MPCSVARSATPVAATLLFAFGLSACATEPVEPPIPSPREAPINSLALEQCLKVNGPEKCAG